MAIDPKLIKKALLVNGFIFAYFIMPNISTLLGIVFLISIIFVEKPYDYLGRKMTEISGDGSCNNNTQCCVQRSYNQFLKGSLAKQALILFGVFMLSKICWFIPNWLILIIIGQLYVFWSFVKEFGVFQMLQQKMRLVKDSVQKLMKKIPKYEQNQ